MQKAEAVLASSPIQPARVWLARMGPGTPDIPAMTQSCLFLRRLQVNSIARRRPITTLYSLVVRSYGAIHKATKVSSSDDINSTQTSRVVCYTAKTLMNTQAAVTAATPSQTRRKKYSSLNSSLSFQSFPFRSVPFLYKLTSTLPSFPGAPPPRFGSR